MKNPLPSHADWRSVLQYAVAVPLMPADEGWQLILELRNPHLRSHPNEVSFPGGRIEAYDAHPGVTALREMAEEIGTPSESWELLGALPLAYTVNGRMVAPYLAFREDVPKFVCNPAEVNSVFTVPLQWLMEHEPVRVEMQDGVRPGENFPYERVTSVVPGWTGRQKYDVYFYTYGDFTIWGLTARIIRNFLQICREQKISFDFDFRQWRGDLT